jgi:hypothetical protein
LFEAGVDDGAPESGPHGHRIGFDREAASFQDAVLSAIQEVESAQFDVLRVEPDEIASAADIAERTVRSRPSDLVADQRHARAREAGLSPSPATSAAPCGGGPKLPHGEAYDHSQAVDGDQATSLAAVNELLGAPRAGGRGGVHPHADAHGGSRGAVN